MKKSLLLIGSSLLVILFIFYGVAIVIFPQLFENLAVKNASDFGGSFGVFASLFSGLALVCLVFTLYQQNEMLEMQREELKFQREELKLHREEVAKGVSSQISNLHVRLMEMAITDTDLQEVWKPTVEITEPTFKQLFYVNLILSHWEMLFSNGDMSEEKLTFHINKYADNIYFKSFWKSSGAHRIESISEDTTSKSAKFQFMLNKAFVS
ncbi:DUF6082 family protein [Vibrio sinaloensis]|uniref:DUF6082 family protein n=1 Tax=Photobacterium sp. (strain ATCC 43367) TaxID=379097 RepID=UPI0035E6681E